jgi:hypothetical protein
MISAKRLVKDLDPGLILIPERYDPRRIQETSGVRLGDLVLSAKDSLIPSKASTELKVLVLDTGDADRGLLAPKNHPIPAGEIGSNKKLVEPGDVLISRLRPYLRQIAYIPNGLTVGGVGMACSTEFFVLRSRSDSSIAFLVHWLLDEKTQEVLRVGQEGGHHPRFSEDHLLNLIVPEEIIENRNNLSKEIERASKLNIDAMKILGSFPISNN